MLGKEKEEFKPLKEELPPLRLVYDGKTSPVIFESEPYTCPGCFQRVQDITHENGYSWKFGCNCKANKEAKKSQERYEAIKHERYYRKSLPFIPPKFQNVSFDDYVPTNQENSKVKRICERYATNYDPYNPQSLFLYGDTGLGKSMLSACIMNALKAKYKIMYIDVNQVLNNISMSWNSNSDLSKHNYQEEITRYIRTADLVIFDDVGASARHSTMMAQLLVFIQSRMGKHSIFTTNLTHQELTSDKDWKRIFSRMMENGTALMLQGEDNRIKGKFREAGTVKTQKAQEVKKDINQPYDLDDPPF